MATPVRRAFPPAPFVAPVGGDIDQRLAQIATAINTKADSTATPVFSAVQFRATDGSTWQLRISPTGTILIDQVVV
jgi:hypothetical protein